MVQLQLSFFAIWDLLSIPCIDLCPHMLCHLSGTRRWHNKQPMLNCSFTMVLVIMSRAKSASAAVNMTVQQGEVQAQQCDAQC